MKALLIKDLSLSADLGAAEMSAVAGGTGYCAPVGCGMPSLPKFDWGHGGGGDIDFNASQMLGQTQNTTVNNGNNVAFASGISAHVNPSQNGTNTINFSK